MQAALNLMPLAAFGLAYHFGGIYLATAVLMGAMVLLVALDYLLFKRVSRLHGYSALLVLVLGTLTLVLHNPLFLQWKPTILMWSLALVFLGSQWIGAVPLAQRLFEPALPPDTPLGRPLWIRVNLLWALGYALLGVANLWVVRVASEATWVHFKLYGLTIILLLASVAQGLWLQTRGKRA